MVAVAAEADSSIDGLEEAVLVDAGNDEAGLVEGLGALGAGADADGGEGMPHAGEETALLRQGTTVTDHSEGVHLQAVVVVEAERLVLDDAAVELETAGL